MKTQNGLTLWNDNAWRTLADLRREMDRLFYDFWPTPTMRTWQDDERHFVPACEVEEADGHYLLTLEMPGIAKEDIKVEVIDNKMIISGERKSERMHKEKANWYSERRFGKFGRTFTLPAGVDADKVEANYQDGILRLLVPKAESARPRQISITNGDGTGFFGRLLGQSPRKEKEDVHSSSERKTERVA